jgi:hypothetical protein
MMRHSMMRVLVLASALLALAGCKKSNTAADADSEGDDNGVRLLDKGQRPRAELRYRVPAGTTTSSTTTFRVATLATSGDTAALSVLPGLRLDFVSGPAELTDRGVKLPVDVVKSEALVPDDFDEEMAELLRNGAAIVDEVGGWVEVDDRGRLLAGELNEQTKRSDVPMRLLRMIVNTRATLTRVVLPAEKVGLGARWETTQEIIAYGFNVKQVNTYTLVDQAEQMALPQTIDFPEEGIEISVESMTAQANGQIILKLNALESDASATGTAEDRIIVKTAKGTESVHVEEQFEIQVANTSALPGN